MKIYFDENFSARLIAGLDQFQQGRKTENISVESCVADFGRGCADEEWLPQVAQKHGVVLTQDQNIHRTKAQWELCRQNKIGIFFLKAPRKGWGYWEIINEVVERWATIKELSNTQRPFGFVIDPARTKFKLL